VNTENEVPTNAAQTTSQPGHDTRVSTQGSHEAASTVTQPARSRRRRRSSDDVPQQDEPHKRRRLRDLPVRRAAASLATATATAAATLATATATAAASLATATATAAATGEVTAVGATEGRDDGDEEGAASAATKACPVCLLTQADVAVIPCGHCICVRCFDHITSMPAVNADNPQPKSCPVCRSIIHGKLHLHFVL